MTTEVYEKGLMRDTDIDFVILIYTGRDNYTHSLYSMLSNHCQQSTNSKVHPVKIHNFRPQRGDREDHNVASDPRLAPGGKTLLTDELRGADRR